LKEKGGLIFHVFTAMELSVNVSQSLVGYMSIDLGRGYILVSQEFLNGSQVNSLAEQISGIAVPQSVRSGEERDIS
jgi:hypothetical protein